VPTGHTRVAFCVPSSIANIETHWLF
jgi:hypothetical protein